jgi:hypothetical protein
MKLVDNASALVQDDRRIVYYYVLQNVIPAQAGIQDRSLTHQRMRQRLSKQTWVPACAGTTFVRRGPQQPRAMQTLA